MKIIKKYNFINKSTNNVKLTIGLPIYRCQHIFWLVLEGLSRQKNINFDWEIVAIEEKEDNIGKKLFPLYADQLKKIGCVNIHYSIIEKWIPLSYKWHYLANVSAISSLCFLLQGADDFPQPFRLKETYDIFEKINPDWVKTPIGLFYDISSGNVALQKKNGCGRDMAIKMKLMKQLPLTIRKSSVDHWIFYTLQNINKKTLNVYTNNTNNWKHGFCTAGLNNISEDRSKYICQLIHPFTKYNKIKFLRDIPKKIIIKITNCMKYTKTNKYI